MEAEGNMGILQTAISPLGSVHNLVAGPGGRYLAKTLGSVRLEGPNCSYRLWKS